MCLIAFAIGACARWPLVIAANRDEFFARTALALASWQTPSGQTILSGRDLRGGGTWLGVTPSGRVAMLTNIRQARNPVRPRSRGELVTRWLEGDLDTDGFMDWLDAAAYGGFNLVTGDVATGRWSWFSNRSFGQAGEAFGEDALRHQTLAPGVYGLSNAELDTPWPKTVALAEALRSAIACTGVDELSLQLQEALESRQRVPLESVPRTGVSPQLEHILSSALVTDPGRGYGTRCSTVLVAGQAGADARLPVHMEEITRTADGGRAGKVVLGIGWNSAQAARQPAG